MTTLRSLLVFSLPAGIVAAQGFQCDFQPTVREVVLNTDFTQVQSSNCPPVNVTGGVFLFRSVRIPAGVTVRGEGSRPMVWIVAGDFVVEGDLILDGRDGARVDTLHSANFPAPGGIGACGGGAGGDGSPNTIGTSYTGEPGFGPGNVPGGGGRGGIISCTVAANQRGSGGGGGSFATAGDPFYKRQSSGTSMVQQLGMGGWGDSSRTLPGGTAGPLVLGDGIADNDFFGVGYDLFRRRVVVGELPTVFGGSGGGGGGDRSVLCINNPNWILDAKGGGGGGGGGALVVLAAGRIVVASTGHVRCNGGNGGGGEQAGSNSHGGGGAGGSGGMVALFSYHSIELHAHGETYANDDYDFAVAADGGVGTKGFFQGLPIAAKYPPPPVANFDVTGSGGFGGLGVIQLATIVDGRNADGTNTILDDHVHVLQNGVRLVGAAKQRYLAWRGFLDASGTRVDDQGRPTNIGANEGDLRPAPALLPLFR
jgi:hypothetical protein